MTLAVLDKIARYNCVLGRWFTATRIIIRYGDRFRMSKRVRKHPLLVRWFDGFELIEHLASIDSEIAAKLAEPIK
jgi:hypothetical protein